VSPGAPAHGRIWAIPTLSVASRRPAAERRGESPRCPRAARFPSDALPVIMDSQAVHCGLHQPSCIWPGVTGLPAVFATSLRRDRSADRSGLASMSVGRVPEGDAA